MRATMLLHLTAKCVAIIAGVWLLATILGILGFTQ